jgi:hypothetical protein
MDFLKKIFGGNAANASSANQENFVVDETGNAQETDSMSGSRSSSVAPIATENSTPITQTSTAPVASDVSQTVNPEHVSETVSIADQNHTTENSSQSEGEYVSDTSAFDELMKQAESSVDARVLDEPIIDPEFKKAKDEIEKEGGIEIFPAE